MPRSYAPDQFVERLRDNSLTPLLSCTGLAKSVDGDNDAFLFALGARCGNWLRIPHQLIEDVSFLGNAPCKDHEHPLVEVIFKDPDPADLGASTFHSMLTAVLASAPNLVALPRELPVAREPAAPFIGEWFARILEVAEWFGGPDVPGGGADPALNAACRKAYAKCHRMGMYRNISKHDQKEACDLMDALC